MTVHSTQLYAANALASGNRDVYTVPTGKRTIWKSYVVLNNAASAQRVVLSVKHGGVTIGFLTVFCAASGSAGDTQEKQIWIVLNTGDVINVNNPTTSVTVMLSGAELKL